MAEKGKGRSLKDRLVDLGVLVEKDDSQSDAPGSASAPNLGASHTATPAAGSVDRDLLKQLLAAATKETNDYTEFMLSADAMSGVIPDEATRLRAAFVASKPHGLTLDRILAGLGSSKRVLDGKRSEFERVLTQKVDALVTSKQKQADETRQTIDSKRQQLTQLQADITALEQAEAKLRADINSGQSQIETAKANFLAAYNAAITTLSSNEDKLKTQLKGA
jgi:chromosome segregation ATPase